MIVRVTAMKDASGRLRKLTQSLGPAGRAELNAGAAARMWMDVRAHLRRYAQSHHATARRLGAQPTGHLEQAAATTTHSSDAKEATVTVSSPGIRRAFGSLIIKPRRARALTIPVHALAYGRRVAEVSRTHRVFRLPKTNVLAADIDGNVTALYVLKAAVTLPQDRSILPSDKELVRSANTGYAAVIRNIISKHNRSGGSK